MFKALITVTLRESILDPQGVAVKGSLHTLGFQGVEAVRIGKRLEVTLQADHIDHAKEQVQLMCEKLLANPVIETFHFEIEEVE